jgi:predicted secreted protein
MPYTGSAAFAGRSSQLQRGNGATPEVFTTISEIKSITRGGSKADLADVTNMDSGNYREFLPTLLDAGEFSFEGNYVPSDVTTQNLQADFDNQVKRNWQIVLPNSLGTWSFAGYVSALNVPDLKVADAATIAGTIKITGAPTFTA